MVQINEMNLHLSWQGYVYILILFHMVYSKYLLYSFLVKLDNYVTWVTTVGASTLKSSMNAHMFLLPPWSTKKEREDERGLEMHTIMYISQKRKCHYTLSQYISFQSAFHIRYHPLSWYYSQLYFHWTYYYLPHLQFFHTSKVEHSDLTWNSSVVCTHRLNCAARSPYWTPNWHSSQMISKDNCGLPQRVYLYFFHFQTAHEMHYS